MIDENDAHENGEEPIAISENGETVITSWEMWVNLCKNKSLKNEVVTLRLHVSDEKKGEPLEIIGFEKMKVLVIEGGGLMLLRNTITGKPDFYRLLYYSVAFSQFHQSYLLSPI